LQRDFGIAAVESERRSGSGGHGSGHSGYRRGKKPEYRFVYRDTHPRLPVWRDGQFQIVRWGNKRGQSRALPRTVCTWQSTVKGGWAGSAAVLVDIPASYGLERRSVWFLIEVDIRGLLMPDKHGMAVCYMICEPASHYCRIMTGSPRMPVLIDQRI
jgi:hypothetical protein